MAPLLGAVRSFALTYSVATRGCCPGGVNAPTQQLCEGTSHQFVQETVHGRLEGLIHGGKPLDVQEVGQSRTLVRETVTNIDLL